jgi:hypothetical protein
MAKSRAKQFSSILSLLDDSINIDKLQVACRKILSDRQKKEIGCRHKKNLPANRCFTRGTLDKNKSPCLRQSHLLKALGTSSPAEAHLRAYHIAFFSKASVDEIKKLQSDSSNFEIRHTCGHRDCDNPDHLKLGSVLQNERDKNYHFVLDKSNNPEALLKVLKETTPGLDVL